MELKEIVKDSVAILSPCGGDVPPKVYQSMMSVASFSSINGYVVRQVGVTMRTLIHTARSMLVDGFLNSECEWSFWVDNDMLLEPRTIPVLINWAKKLNAKMVTGIYHQRIGYYRPLVMIRDKNRQYNDDFELSFAIVDPSQKRPFEIDACGFGCVAIHREVYLKLKQPLFMHYPLKNGKELSEDFYFCKKVREAGISIYAVPELKCGHIGEPPTITRENFDNRCKELNIKREGLKWH